MGKKYYSRLRGAARLSVPFVAVLMMFYFQQCGKKSFENPLDPNNDDYEKPRIVHLSLDSTDTLFQTDTLTVTWRANYPEFCEYSYRFQSTDAWSAWVSDTTLLDIVADADYTFQISVRYKGKVDTTMVTRTFRVVTLTGPAVYLYPLRRTVSAAAPTTSYSICCKKLDTCNAMELVVRGVTINDVTFANSAITNSFVFKCDSVITIGLSPTDMPICNTMPFLNISVTPPPAADTTDVVVYVPSARFITDSTQQEIAVYQVKGGFIVQN